MHAADAYASAVPALAVPSPVTAHSTICAAHYPQLGEPHQGRACHARAAASRAGACAAVPSGPCLGTRAPCLGHGQHRHAAQHDRRRRPRAAVRGRNQGRARRMRAFCLRAHACAYAQRGHPVHYGTTAADLALVRVAHVCAHAAASPLPNRTLAKAERLVTMPYTLLPLPIAGCATWPLTMQRWALCSTAVPSTQLRMSR